MSVTYLSCNTELDIASGAVSEPGDVLAGHRVAVRDGVVQLLEVRVPGGRLMGIDDSVRGHALVAGDRLEVNSGSTGARFA